MPRAAAWGNLKNANVSLRAPEDWQHLTAETTSVMIPTPDSFRSQTTSAQHTRLSLITNPPNKHVLTKPSSMLSSCKVTSPTASRETGGDPLPKQCRNRVAQPSATALPLIKPHKACPALGSTASTKPYNGMVGERIPLPLK